MRRDWWQVALGILVGIALVVLILVQLRSCLDCAQRGGAYVEPRNGFPTCVEKLP